MRKSQNSIILGGVGFMNGKTNVWKILYKIGVTLAYIAMIVVLCLQALTPATQSSDISNSVGDKLDDIITDIQQPESEPVDIESFTIDSIVVAGKTLDPQGVVLLLGQKGKLQCTVLPEDTTNKALTYTSSDESIVKAYADGTLEGKKAGEATIEVRSQDNEALTQSITVGVKEVPIQGFTISASQTTIRVGETHGFNIKYTPSDTTERALVWKSSDESVLTVSSSGKMKGISVGKATVTATSKVNGSLIDSIEITVLEKLVIPEVPITALEIKHDGIGYIGKSDTLKNTITPGNATNKKLVWSSSDPTTVSVDQSGNVHYLKIGTAIITVSSSAYNVSNSVEITVKEILSKTIELDTNELTYSEEDGYSLRINTSATLTAILEEDATVLDVRFSSSDPDIAKISQDGTIEGVSLGEVVLTVSTSYEGETTEVELTLTVTPVPFSEQFENFSLWVRKTFGHFGAFLLLGIAAALTYHTWFPKSTRGKALAFAVCLVAGFAVAGLTEILQLPIFTQGRGPSFNDVLLDFSGYCWSSVLIFTWTILWSILKTMIKRDKLI